LIPIRGGKTAATDLTYYSTQPATFSLTPA
jgi:hypothetical protein